MIITKPELCTGCTLCENVCPKSAIKMKENEEGFLYPHISSELCIECGLCQKKCPSNSKNIFKRETPHVYAVKHKDDEIRRNSTSGGMFTAISDYILDQDGVVYGAAYDDQFVVRHIRADNIAVRNLMRGSKYVQSRMDDTLLNIKKDLEENKIVLFTGTPCQCAAVRGFFKDKYYDNLYLVDLVCEGTPSPLIVKSFFEFIANKNKDTVTKVEFRNKTYGWSNSAMAISMKENKYCMPSKTDYFYQLFMGNLIMRSSCHHCPYTSDLREGDITIGDFWGIDKVNPEFCDEKGVSLVIVNTPKGMDVLNAIKEKLIVAKQTLCEAKKRQPNLSRPNCIGKRRSELWADYKKRDIEYVLRKYTTYGTFVRCKRFVKKILIKIRLYK